MLHLDYADLDRLLQDSEDDVLSLYLQVDPADPANQSDKPAWRIRLDNALDELAAKHGERIEPVRARVERYVAHYRPEGKTLVLFARPGALQAVSLPVKLGSRHAYGAPLVDPLLWAIDEYEHYLIVLVDADHVRTVSAYLGSSEADAVELEPGGHWAPKHYSRTGHTSSWESHVDEWQQRWVRAIADQLQDVANRSPTVPRIILGGNEKEAHALRSALHPKLRRHVIGVVPLEMYLSDDQVLAQVWPIARAYERSEELDIVRSVVDRAKSGDRGALGAQAVGEALELQQVRRLILAAPVEDQKLATELIRKSFASSAKIEFVHGPAAELLRAEGKVGGVAADLYWA